MTQAAKEANVNHNEQCTNIGGITVSDQSTNRCNAKQQLKRLAGPTQLTQASCRTIYRVKAQALPS